MKPAVWIAAAAALALVVWMFAAARQPTGDEGLYTILSQDQYNQTLNRVRELTQGPIIAYDSDQRLTEQQVEDLREGTELIKKLIAFQPRDFAPYVMMGKTRRALGEMDEAARNYHQALLLMPADTLDQDVIWTSAEVRFDLGIYYYESGDYPSAEVMLEEAVARFPTEPRYMAGLAAVKAQVNKLEEARYWTNEALKYDPANATALELDEELKRIGS